MAWWSQVDWPKPTLPQNWRQCRPVPAEHAELPSCRPGTWKLSHPVGQCQDVAGAAACHVEVTLTEMSLLFLKATMPCFALHCCQPMTAERILLPPISPGFAASTAPLCSCGVQANRAATHSMHDQDRTLASISSRQQSKWEPG
jgi:hypothetical protein